MKKCKICKKEFIQKYNAQKYCNELCYLQATKELKKIYQETHKEQRKKYDREHNKRIKKQKRKWFLIHKKEESLRCKIYYETNKDKIKKQHQKWCKKHKKEINLWTREYIKNKYEKNINFKIESNLRSRVRLALKGNPKLETTMKLIGCSIDFFRNYYESKFTSGMSWAKVMSGKIHCDHIKPCASFDLSKVSEQRKCFHYTNLQPLWAKENLNKGSKIL